MLIKNFLEYEDFHENQLNLDGSRYIVEAYFLNFFEVPTKLIWGEGGATLLPQVGGATLLPHMMLYIITKAIPR